MTKRAMKKRAREDIQPRRIDVLAVVLFVVLLLIAIVFFVMLGSFTGEGFGFFEILFALTFAVFVSALLIWCKSIMLRNPYLGASIGVLSVIALGYGFLTQFTGPKSITFMVITSIIILVYLGFYFFRYKDKEKMIPDEFDER